jgi:hypothetical protein
MESFEIRLTNLSSAAKEQEIRDLVSAFSKVLDVKLILDYKQRSRGKFYNYRFGFCKIRK